MILFLILALGVAAILAAFEIPSWLCRVAKWTGVFLCMGALSISVSLLGVMGEYGTLDSANSLFENLLTAVSPLLIAVPPTVILFWRVRQHRIVPLGYCQQCGYNLTGNESGVCPECATPVPKQETNA